MDFFYNYFLICPSPLISPAAFGWCPVKQHSVFLFFYGTPQGGGTHPVLLLKATGKLKLLLPGRKKVMMDQLWVWQAKCISKSLFQCVPSFLTTSRLPTYLTAGRWTSFTYSFSTTLFSLFICDIFAHNVCCLVDFDRGVWSEHFLLKQEAIFSTRGRSAASRELLGFSDVFSWTSHEIVQMYQVIRR